jgi:hypothetical protein
MAEGIMEKCDDKVFELKRHGSSLSLNPGVVLTML